MSPQRRPIEAPCYGNLTKIQLQLSPSFHVFPPSPLSFFWAGVNVENQLRFHRSRQCQTWHPCWGGRWVRPIPAVAGKVSPFSRARSKEVGGSGTDGWVAEDLWDAHFCRWDSQIRRDGNSQPLISIHLRVKKSRIMFEIFGNHDTGTMSVLWTFLKGRDFCWRHGWKIANLYQGCTR